MRLCEGAWVRNEDLYAAMPLTELVGMELASASPERVELTLAWRADLCTAAGALHGGTIMALADTAGGMLAFLNLPEGATGTSTIESKTNMLRAVREGDAVRAVATLLHQGRTTIVVETELRVGERLVAKTTQTQSVLT